MGEGGEEKRQGSREGQKHWGSGGQGEKESGGLTQGRGEGVGSRGDRGSRGRWRQQLQLNPKYE